MLKWFSLIKIYLKKNWCTFTVWTKIRLIIIIPLDVLLVIWFITNSDVLYLCLIPVFVLFAINENKVHRIRADTDKGYPMFRILPFLYLVMASHYLGVFLIILGMYVFVILLILLVLLYLRFKHFTVDDSNFKQQKFEANSKFQIVYASIIQLVMPLPFAIVPAVYVLLGTESIICAVCVILVTFMIYGIFFLEEIYPYIWVLRNLKRIVRYPFGEGRFYYSDDT